MRITKSILFLFALAGLLPAASITFNPAPTTDTGWNPCGNYAGFVRRTTAYFDAQSLNDQNDSHGISPLFQQAFDAWNESVSGGDGLWTLHDGGDLVAIGDADAGAARRGPGGDHGAVDGQGLDGRAVDPWPDTGQGSDLRRRQVGLAQALQRANQRWYLWDNLRVDQLVAEGQQHLLLAAEAMVVVVLMAGAGVL